MQTDGFLIDRIGEMAVIFASHARERLTGTQGRCRIGSRNTPMGLQMAMTPGKKRSFQSAIVYKVPYGKC